MSNLVSELGSIVKRTLFAGVEIPALTTVVTVISGEGALGVGSVLGKVTMGAVTAASVSGITGNGTCTPDATAPLLANAQPSVYKAVCITAGASAVFRVYDPKGNVLGDVTVGNTFANQIKFALAAGTTNFAAGDQFNITVADGSGYKLVDSSAVDGSQVAELILGEDVDATSADVVALAFKSGIYNYDALSVASGDTVAAHVDELRLRSIHYRTDV